nr:hypothetical protein [Chloroflexota bacterium]
MSTEITEKIALISDDVGMASMMEYALDFSAQKTGYKNQEQVLEALRGGDCSVCEYLRYGLAQKIAEYLGSADQTVKAVYVYEPEYATAWTGQCPTRAASRRASA